MTKIRNTDTGSILLVDENKSIENMKSIFPNFFKHKNYKSERYTAYRGSLIVSGIPNYSFNKFDKGRVYVGYLFAMIEGEEDKSWDTFCCTIDGANRIKTIERVKRIIDYILEGNTVYYGISSRV